MTKTFNCASCSAPLEFEGTAIQKCRYCGSTIIAPPEMFHSSSSVPFGDFSSLTGKALKIAEIDQLIHNGQKLEAIKLFRETFGVGLAEAKDAVERMERGESVDISGMHVKGSRRATAEDVEKIKKIGYTIGGSILLTILVSLLIIGGVTIAVLYFTWSAMDKIPVAANTSRPASPAPDSGTTAAPGAVELLQIGGEGNGAGRFKDNRAVAVDGMGRIYSSDYSPHRIQMFDAEGKFLNQWAPETGSNLYDLAADREGNVYLANDKGIFKHDGASGKLLAKSTSVSARGIALTGDGKLIATNRKSIVVMDSSLNAVNEFKDAAERANSTFGFEKLATDGSGTIYALDDRTSDICRFSSDGKFLNRFKSGANAPHAIAVDPKGRLFVSDTSTIFVLDAEGTPMRSLDTYQAFGIAFDQNGDLFIAARPYVVKQKLTF
jgi:hypothetical protein